MKSLPNRSNTETKKESPYTSRTELPLFASLPPGAAKRWVETGKWVTQASKWIKFLHPPWHHPPISDLTAAAPPTSCPDNEQSQREPSFALIDRQWLHSPPTALDSVRGVGESNTPLIATLQRTGSDKQRGVHNGCINPSSYHDKGQSYTATMFSLFLLLRTLLFHSCGLEDTQVDCDGSTWERPLSNDWVQWRCSAEWCVWSSCCRKLI